MNRGKVLTVCLATFAMLVIAAFPAGAQTTTDRVVGTVKIGRAHV